MRQHDDRFLDVLSGSFTRQLWVNVYHGTDRVMQDLRVEEWSLDGDVDGKVSSSGSGTIVHESVAGESLSPMGTKGVLSAFRARLELVMEISAGRFVRRVSLGLFRLTKVLGAVDYTAVVNGREVVVASRVRVSFLSLEEDVRRRGLRSDEQPPSLTSCYDEIRRLTDMPVEESVPDAPIPSTTTWEAKRDGRLDAVKTLGRVLGGTALVNSAGAWTIIPDEPGDVVGELHLGEHGTVLDVAADVDTDEIYNVVVGVFEDENRNPIYSVAEAPPGDLSPDGLYGEHTQYFSDDLVKTQAQADAATQAELARSIGSQQYDVQIQCHVNPLVELGDVLALKGWSTPLVGQLRSLSMSDSAYMNVTLRVAREL